MSWTKVENNLIYIYNSNLEPILSSNFKLFFFPILLIIGFFIFIFHPNISVDDDDNNKFYLENDNLIGKMENIPMNELPLE